MEKHVWLVAMKKRVDELKFVSMEYGVQFALDHGVPMMPEYFADNLGFHLLVSSKTEF